jgi:predicted transcriptional regulator YdeE
MNQRTISKKSFQVIGIEMTTSNEKSMEDIPVLWEKFYTRDIKKNIPNKLDNNILAIYTNYEGNYTMPYTYLLGCVVSSLSDIPEGMIGKSISSAKYEIFTAKGKMPDKIVEAWQYIWGPEIDAKRSYVTDFEVYGDKYNDLENSEVEVYIGVKE